MKRHKHKFVNSNGRRRCIICEPVRTAAQWRQDIKDQKARLVQWAKAIGGQP